MYVHPFHVVFCCQKIELGSDKVCFLLVALVYLMSIHCYAHQKFVFKSFFE